MKTKILFVCPDNGAWSQMAEAFVNRYCNECFAAESAGVQPGKIDPLAVEAMAEDGIDISGNATRFISEVLKPGRTYDYIISLFDEASEHPQALGASSGATRLNWSFPRLARFVGIHAEQLEEVRNVRNAIAARVATWCEDISGVCNHTC
jgi:arsenate reductase